MDRKLIIIPNFGKGGAERVLSRILLSFSKEEIKKLTFLTLNHEIGYDLPSELNIIKLKQKRLKKAIPKLLKIINTGRWSMIYSTLNHFNLILPLLVFKRKNIKLVCRESILPITYYRSLGFFGKILLLYYRLIMKRYDVVIVQSNDMLNEVNKLNIKTTFLINNPSPNFKSVFNHNKINNFIYVARWHDQKNYKFLLKYWKWINEEKKFNKKLICVGVGNKAKDLNNEYSKYNIKFISKHSNVEDILMSSSYYLNFSKFEGFSNSILEALSCGLPVFTLDFLGGKQEMLNKNNSIISKIKSSEANEKDFDVIFKEMTSFINKKWDCNSIKTQADEKFNIIFIIKSFKEIFFK
ncbi:glycosyltransferase, GT1 family [Formosa sp. Hel3_A1_48]|uniref:glycosyltransferase n=1 Tax=Formosa sp. Hel3_A1_48 TaxID=1336795 RepID=UPI00084E0B67|nr:glycosyltransferase [Formosa sp. Hel3_A1_48]AOR26758.1 glycosyltransferase, GT1 family [Formosa sp. Hel3_A1_48]